MFISCPFCKTEQNQKPLKSWQYGRLVQTNSKKESIITCFRYSCKCGKLFNHYVSKTGKSWTIPKPKESTTN